MADAYCTRCGAGMSGDEAALNYKYVGRQCTVFLCPACLGEKLGVTPDDLHHMIYVFRTRGCRLFSPLLPGEKEHRAVSGQKETDDREAKGEPSRGEGMV